ncbi:hypothetical protein GCM10027022_01600 [Alpinimonas psychrophila]
MRLALAPEEFEDDDASNPSDGKARQSEESNEEEFQCKQHGFILIIRPGDPVIRREIHPPLHGKDAGFSWVRMKLQETRRKHGDHPYLGHAPRKRCASFP